MSKTKRILNKSTIEKLVKHAFDVTHIEFINELTDGYFSMCYLIKYDSKKVVLKVAPKSDVLVLTNEKNIIEAEIAALRILQDQIRVPKLLFVDDTKTIFDTTYFFMSYFDGVTLNKIKDDLSDDELISIYQSLADDVKKIHKNTSNYFGYLHDPSMRFNTWFDCFKAMIKSLYQDAVKINYHIPLALKDFEEILEDNRRYFDINKPQLIHKDLWEGNIIIKDNKYIGIIDCERVLYGDPMLDLICGNLDSNDLFLKQYNQKFTNTEITSKFYNYYMYLLMYIEIPYRDSETNYANWVKKLFSKSIKELYKIY